MTGFGIVGYGEVGSIFAADLVARGGSVRAFDVAQDAQARARAVGYGAGSPHDAVRDAEVVFVCVTAGSTMDAMRSLVGGLAHAPFVVDVNSVAPATKQENARLIESAGGRYVEAAVMASVPPTRLRTPILLGGPHAADFLRTMAPFEMDLTDYSREVGRPSSVKMCRSVMIKGIEALTSECMLSARHYGVEKEVLQSLADTLPHPDWPGLARFMISRALIHGKRRAEEMREVAVTVQNAGIEPLMTRAIVERQEWAWRRGAAMGEARNLPTLEPLLDALTEAAKLPKAAE